jgi:acyl-CoA thioesterase-2
VDRLLALLELEAIDRDIYRGVNPGEGPGRVFGGQVASQALRAAAATVEVEHQVNSLHAYFLRPGRFGVPIVYTVDRIRDGSSFTTRRVVAVQQGEAILNLDASFHKHEPGGEYGMPSPIDDVPAPESLPEEPVEGRAHRRHIERREVDPPPAGSTRARWVRAGGTLPDDPVIHACVIAYLSDMGPVHAARLGLGELEHRVMTASLDHCLWFHRPARADEWLLYELSAVAGANSRGVARGAMWTRTGELAVTVTQEALLRPVSGQRK